jgi:hippurate hydrolase
VAAQYVLALQTLISRRNDPQDPAVITVGSLHVGTKRNVISDKAELLLTVRSYDDAVRKRLLDGIAQQARDLCVAAGCPKPPTVYVKEQYTPAVYNDPTFAASATNILAAELGPQNVGVARAAMSGEDFGLFGKQLKIPSLLIRLGATTEAAQAASRKPGAAPLPTLHSSRFAPDAALALRTGVRTMVALSLSVLAKSAP